jgi:hypothetical protein
MKKAPPDDIRSLSQQKDGQLRIRGATFFTAEAVTRRSRSAPGALTQRLRLPY